MVIQLDPRKTVTITFSRLLSDPSTRPEFIDLIGRAEEVGSYTFAASLAYLLSGVRPDFSPRREGETANSYVERLVKFLISQEEGSASLAVEDFFMEMSDFRGSSGIQNSLRKVIKNRMAAGQGNAS